MFFSKDINLLNDNGSIIKPHQGFINKITLLARQKRVSVCLVGGYVRDLIIGHLSSDMDLVIEPDAVDFAQAVQKILPGKLKIFEQFKTAKLIIEKTFQIDFATARTEVYESPAALPKVSAGDLKDDLLRRDFTVNSLAVSLNTEDYGCLIDCSNGLQDIKDKKIRVLHDRSFIDDPTRIFRAIRFEQRLGFEIEEHTLDLIAGAVSNKMIDKLDRYRFHNEIELIKREKGSSQMIERAERLLGKF